MPPTRKAPAEMPTDTPQVPGQTGSVWFRDATAEAHPEYQPRPDSEALTDEQKAHLKEYGLL
jgi:hypothetical protein